NLLADVYAVIGDADASGGHVLRLYHNPLVPWIWLGAAAMALGGLVSLSDRRHRVGAPARRRREVAAARVQAAEGARCQFHPPLHRNPSPPFRAEREGPIA